LDWVIKIGLFVKTASSGEFVASSKKYRKEQLSAKA
jgi:hypothetical protein